MLFTASYNGGCTCGAQFNIGASYLVFAGKNRPMLSNEEAERPKEDWTLEMRLEADAD